jgi:hypothetical protein
LGEFSFSWVEEPVPLLIFSQEGMEEVSGFDLKLLLFMNQKRVEGYVPVSSLQW